MALNLIRVHVNLHSQTHPFHFPSPKNHQISCSLNPKSSSSRNSLAHELTTQIEKLKTQNLQTQEAMTKSKKLLYTQLSLFVGLSENELKTKWVKMEENDKWVLAQEFVKSDWGCNFHPLSVKSVKELVDQYLLYDDKDGLKDSTFSSDSSMLFDGLKKLMGFSNEDK